MQHVRKTNQTESQALDICLGRLAARRRTFLDIGRRRAWPCETASGWRLDLLC
jgi:hypothetical protein